MFKHLKNFLIATVLTFSFINNINAQTVTIENSNISDINFTFNGVTYNYEKIKSDIETQLSSCGTTLDDYTGFLLTMPSLPTPSTSGNAIYRTFFRIALYNNAEITGYDFYNQNYELSRFTYSGNDSGVIIQWDMRNNTVNHNCSATGLFNTDIHRGASSSNYFKYYSNINWNNVINVNANETYPVYSKLLVDNSLFNSLPYQFNFHLNGGHGSCIIGMHTPVIPLLYDDENFSINTDDYDIYDVLSNLEIEKDNMIFDGFYYDPNFTQPFSANDNFDEHATVGEDAKVINLYAKYRYKTVDDFLTNTNFTTYTFDTNYDYAIINRGNNSDIVYMGLPFSNYELEIYEFQENTNTYKDGASACLVPIFSKNKYYYYELNTLFTNNQEVLILPRYLFEQLDPNDFDDPGDTHKFYLTTNAYVTYTNDLTHVTITNSQGQQVDTNLQNSFELSQQYKNLYENEKDIYAQIKIFLNNITRYTTAIKGMFQYLFNSLNGTIRSFIIFLVVLILLSTILRFIRRG